MGMEENWKLFVESTKAKAESHEKYAQFWDKINSNLSLTMIFLSTVVTILASFTIDKLVIVGFSGVATLLAAVAGFLQPHARKQTQAESAKEFRSLMLQMIRCETDDDYENLWKEFNKEIVAEPFLPKKYKVEVKQEFSMTPELMILIDEKEDAVAAALAD